MFTMGGRCVVHARERQNPHHSRLVRLNPTSLLFVASMLCPATHQAVKEDLGLQRLILETCRGHLRALRTSTAVAGAGLSVEVGGGGSTRGATASSAGGMQEAPQDEADATRAGKAATKRCTVLAPLLLKEVFRQVSK